LKTFRQYRSNLFTQIDEIIYYGGGGYDYYTIYTFPIWLRNWTFNKLKERFTKENSQSEIQASDVAKQKGKEMKNSKITPPNYITKMSPKQNVGV